MTAPAIPVSESALLAVVRQMAQTFRWRGYHTHDSRHSPRGFPDLCLIRPPRLVFAELKKEGGRVTPAQLEWLHDLAQIPGVEAYVWRPSDLREVEDTLR